MTGHNLTKIIPSGTTEPTAMESEGWKREIGLLASTQDLGQATSANRDRVPGTDPSFNE
jgi:hypothetical protein